MNTEFWGYLSAIIVGISGGYYAFRACQGQIYPNPVSWSVWAVVGVALFLTAEASMIDAVYFSTLVSAFNPALVVAVIIWRSKSKTYTMAPHEQKCLVLALIGYAFWFWVKDEPSAATWSMYWMIVVDIVVLWPTFKQVLADPMSDKPLPWIIFGWGFLLSVLAVEENTFANLVIPWYMFLGSQAIVIPMVVRRIRRRSPLAEWV